ncbi:hypothetical protein LAUMK191_03103 [Mycobacterium attenuatum]|uniref:Uncharacterized protein n=1 Tax=Mycobacterium attenuatum TaxID=2341086 RepID=A0A498Q4X2_9MYCO|nr:hypothetical protein LAUMK136_03127 [Mycobacterium attenuatum]VBA54438.1 hypothetical protein LAUMK191_03103 [Mycobacterium attenuatum]
MNKATESQMRSTIPRVLFYGRLVAIHGISQNGRRYWPIAHQGRGVSATRVVIDIAAAQ